ncbi:MAG: SH3 domain-containing protein [Clostridiales bacterium]|nr:SH3 domain-containing protein [Clostridiales bacterium]
MSDFEKKPVDKNTDETVQENVEINCSKEADGEAQGTDANQDSSAGKADSADDTAQQENDAAGEEYAAVQPEDAASEEEAVPAPSDGDTEQSAVNSVQPEDAEAETKPEDAEAETKPENAEAETKPENAEDGAGAGTPEKKEDAHTKTEGDILDDLEFISHESVKDKSKAATGEVIEDGIVSRKQTRRRSVDAGAARKEKVQKIARKNLIPILIGVIVAVVVIIAAVAGIRKSLDKKAAENKEQPVSTQEYETDAYEQINEVVENYYACYADGDVSTILQYAYPMSETEQTYIQMYSGYVENYENIVCYTKTGADDSSYIVSASFDVKYSGIETTASGMDFFYVRFAEDGSAYIDNTYSPFNLLYQEYMLDQEILQLIQAYEESEDVIALQAGVQTQYEQALAEDEDLRSFVEGDLANAVSAWQSEYESVLAEKAAEAAAQVEEEAQSDENSDSSSEETSEDSSGETGEDDSEESADTSSDVTETEDKAWVYVTDTVYIRESADESSEALASAAAGSQVRQLAVTSDGWTKVKSGDIVGYIKSDYISSSASATSSSGSLSAGTSIRLTSSVNIRSSMSESSDRVGLAYAGETVTVVMSYSEGWTKVTWNGKTGYVRTDILAGM